MQTRGRRERAELDFKKLEICKHLHEGRECWWCNVVMRLQAQESIFIVITTTLVLTQGSKGDNVDFGDEGMQVLATEELRIRGSRKILYMVSRNKKSNL